MGAQEVIIVTCVLPSLPHAHTHTHAHAQAAHRKQTLLIAAFYKSWPRLTFLYVYFFHYYETFLPLIQFHFPLEPADVEVMWKKEQVVQYETENAAENGEVFVETTVRRITWLVACLPACPPCYYG